MNITHVGKIDEGRYTASSLPCPKCADVFTTEITGEELFRINQGVKNVLTRLSAEERERFISGYCPDCWTALFGYDEDDRTYCEDCEQNFDDEGFDYRFDIPICLPCGAKRTEENN